VSIRGQGGWLDALDDMLAAPWLPPSFGAQHALVSIARWRIDTRGHVA